MNFPTTSPEPRASFIPVPMACLTLLLLLPFAAIAAPFVWLVRRMIEL
ncbi:MAG: hypothetical protein JST79_14190 [Acidobacteria bacterium]|jgi:hypothetical protein|nr:hypothetical protein [Acidobacteriota bacterium]